MGLFGDGSRRRERRDARQERIEARQDGKTDRQRLRSEAEIATGGAAGFDAEGAAKALGTGVAGVLAGPAGQLLGFGVNPDADPVAVAQAIKASEPAPVPEDQPSDVLGKIKKAASDNPAATGVVGLGLLALLARLSGRV